MSGFTDSALEKKLRELNQSQQSIQTLSLWLIHHRKHHKAIVHVWMKELTKAKDSHKLVFMYLANDVIQNSKKKGPEFSREFSNVLAKAFSHVYECVSDEKTKKGLERIISVWEERNVYDSKVIGGLWAAMRAKSPRHSSKSPSGRKDKSPKEKKDKKRKAPAAEAAAGKEASSSRKRSRSGVSTVAPPVAPKEEAAAVAAPPSPQGEPPEAEELIRAVQELDNSPSTDALVREKIAQFPPEVSDVTLLDKIHDRGQAARLRTQVDEASSVLSEYNLRLHQELEDRRKLGRMLHHFTHHQRSMLADAEKKMEEFRDQLQRVSLVRSELKSHLRNLPDLTLLPSVTGGLAPLPSAGDLFQ